MEVINVASRVALRLVTKIRNEIKISSPCNQNSLDDSAGQQHLNSTHCTVREELEKDLQLQQEHGNQVSAQQRPVEGAKYASGGIMIILSCPLEINHR